MRTSYPLHSAYMLTSFENFCTVLSFASFLTVKHCVNNFMNADETLREVLQRFSRAGILGVMVGAPVAQPSGVDKGKNLMIGSSQ